LSGLHVIAGSLGRTMADVGVTTFRPPYTPVTIGALAGREIIRLSHPERLTAAHDWHVANGATMMNAGLWKRPLVYQKPGETAQTAVNRQVAAVRVGVGVVDVSTLGKIEIGGADAAELLDRLYTNDWKKLRVSHGRYGLMLREDGCVFDDGVTMRLSENRFLMTTTTANADAVVEWIEQYLQTQWPELKAYAVPVTEQWFAAALSGPNSRAVLARLMPELDVTNKAFPLMSIREGEITGVATRVMRISFSGELSYEINVPADYGLWLWERVLSVGEEFGIVPYGIDAVGVLRIEKGHVVVGAEADGRTTPDDLGLGALVSKSKDFIGRRSLALSGMQDKGRKQLVGLIVDKSEDAFPVGAQIVAKPDWAPAPALGHVTSYAFSPTLGRQVALALVEAGRSRIGEKLFAVSPTAAAVVGVTVTASCFIDQQGKRLRA
jgi:sarcosine oxidase, subunit alpha